MLYSHAKLKGAFASIGQLAVEQNFSDPHG